MATIATYIIGMACIAALTLLPFCPSAF